MSEPRRPDRILLQILLPMLLTFAVQRLFLHLHDPITHVFVRGHLIHHLFTGVLLLIPASFLAAFGTPSPRVEALTRILIGVGSAMVLDEVSFLVCTDGSDAAYRGIVSLGGALLMILLASAALVALHRKSLRNA